MAPAGSRPGRNDRARVRTPRDHRRGLWGWPDPDQHSRVPLAVLRSPQHRWPVAIMLLGEAAARGLFLASFADLPLSPLLDSTTAQIVVVWTAYATALFGFSILDPLVAARQTVVQQMREGMVIFDDRWRIVSVNPAAARILGAPAAQLRGKSWQEVLPIPENLPGQTLPSLSTGDTPPDLAEISLVAGAAVRRYALDLSLLKDPRGLDVGRLLLLLDTTEQRQAQAQVQEQQRTLAVMRERERLARTARRLGAGIGVCKRAGAERVAPPHARRRRRGRRGNSPVWSRSLGRRIQTSGRPSWACGSRSPSRGCLGSACCPRWQPTCASSRHAMASTRSCARRQGSTTGCSTLKSTRNCCASSRRP